MAPEVGLGLTTPEFPNEFARILPLQGCPTVLNYREGRNRAFLRPFPMGNGISLESTEEVLTEYCTKNTSNTQLGTVLDTLDGRFHISVSR